MAPNPGGVLDRPGEPPDVTVRYGPAADHLVDIHLPHVTAPAPVLVLLHGGFWRQGYDRRHTRPMAQALRARGWLVATPEFRRTGGAGGWPQTFDDVAAVRAGLWSLLADVLPGRADLGRLVVAGHSAGGHLALWWALTGDPATLVRAVGLAPVADLARAHADELGGAAVAALMGGSPAELPDRYAAADPAAMLRRVASADPLKYVVVHGDLDAQVPVAHSRDLPGVTLIELRGVEHFGLIDPLSSAWPAVLAAIEGSVGVPQR
ncbi:MAG: alpha/beta hydrolase family protein [Nocardioidaceae bacterium]